MPVSFTLDKGEVQWVLPLEDNILEVSHHAATNKDLT